MGAAGDRIVVGVDGSAGPRAALAWALTEAARRGATVEVISTFPVDFYWTDAYLLDRARIHGIRSDTEAHARVMVDQVRRDASIGELPGAADLDVQALARGEAIVAEVLGPGPFDRDAVRVLALEGHPGEVLVRQAEGARLLVVGCRSRTQSQGVLLGSVALPCVMHAPCPVLVVHDRPDGSTDPQAHSVEAAAPVAG